MQLRNTLLQLRSSLYKSFKQRQISGKFRSRKRTEVPSDHIFPKRFIIILPKTKEEMEDTEEKQDL